MSKQFWGVIVAIIIVFVGIFALTGNKSDTKNQKSNSSALTQHTLGKGTSGVTLVEYGDYQCPFCGEYYPTLKQVIAKYGDSIRFQFRNFPLTSLHQNAFAAARAAEAASQQGKFWQMHDLLYETQTQWSSGSDPTSFFNQFAQQLGLDTVKFKADYGSAKVNDAINADMAEGGKLQISGTPTFFINGTKTEITNTVDSFQKVIDAAIAKQAASSSASTPAKQ